MVASPAGSLAASARPSPPPVHADLLVALVVVQQVLVVVAPIVGAPPNPRA